MVHPIFKTIYLKNLNKFELHHFNMYVEQGKAGGHTRQHFPLPCHILDFCLQTATTVRSSMPQHLSLPPVFAFLNDKYRAVKQEKNDMNIFKSFKTEKFKQNQTLWKN